MTDPTPPVRGLVAAKYELLGLIGRGGMGSVWEGRHATLGTRVAVKFIDPEYAESEEARTRFANEARAAASIQSKHAIHIYDHGLTEDRRPYIVMELLTGEALDKRLDRLGSIPLADTARILQQVCRALQRAHDAGVIHRDLKPENIFLVRTPDDDDEIAKVLDFGIAKIKPPPGEEGLSSSTKTGAVIGTPYYMSPEQARGLRELDHRTDLWSLGVIAHKCVTGVLPFEGESVGDLLVKICTSPVPVPSATVPGLPAAFDAWFARALEREIPRRFATATELAQALWLAAGLTGARGPSSRPGRDGQTFPSAQPAAQPSAAPHLAPQLPGAAVTSAPITASASPRRPSRGALAAVVAGGLLAGSVGVTAVVRLSRSPKAADTAVAAAASPGRPQDGDLGAARGVPSQVVPPPVAASASSAPVAAPPATVGPAPAARPITRATPQPRAANPPTKAAAGQGSVAPADPGY